MGWLSDAASSIAGDVFGSAVSSHYGRDMMEAQAAYNKEMYQNRYQWTVDDLRKAGLNPILATGGLASGSASVSGQSVNAGSVNSAMAAHRKISEVDKANIDIGRENAASNAKTADAAAKNADSGRITADANARSADSNIELNKSRQKVEDANALRTIAAIGNDAKTTSALVSMYEAQGSAALRNAAAAEQNAATNQYSARSNYSWQRQQEKESAARQASYESNTRGKDIDNKKASAKNAIYDVPYLGTAFGTAQNVMDTFGSLFGAAVRR